VHLYDCLCGQFRPDAIAARTPFSSFTFLAQCSWAYFGDWLLFFTGFSRFATNFAQDQIKNMNSRKNQLRMIRSLVDSAADILLDPKTPLRELGELMHQSWLIKRELASSVSNSQIDDIYDAGRDAGAVGGKLLGAGGGFMVLLVDPEMRAQVRERLRKLIHVNVGFDTDGSKIVIYQPDEI
jgi:D-glycero-alpha-D-manno-heptose-7-phosphate kinase